MITKKLVKLSIFTLFSFIFLVADGVKAAEENIDATKSLDFCATVLIVLVSLTSILTDRPSETEVRRRVKFEDVRTGKYYWGGITISENFDDENVKQVRVYSYNFKKFGSSGRYVKYRLNFTDPAISTPGIKNYKEVAEYANFYNVGWKDIQELQFQIRTKVEGNDKPLSYLENLELESNEKDITRYHLKVEEVSAEPKSWIWRLIFYWVNFIFCFSVCCTNIKDADNPQRVSFLSVYMNFLVCILGIKMAFLYWFVGVFWFMAVYSCPTFILFHKVRRLRRTFLPTPSRVYLAIGTLLVIASIILDDIFPYVIIYSSYGLTIDLLANPATSKSKNYSQLINLHVFQIYTMFSFFNQANKKYYSISWINGIIFIVFILLNIIFNYWILCKGGGKGFKALRKAFGGIVIYTESTRTDQIENLSLRGYEITENETWVDYKNHSIEVQRRKQFSQRTDLSDIRPQNDKDINSNKNNSSKVVETLIKDFRSFKVTKPNRFAENSLINSIIQQNQKIERVALNEDEEDFSD